MDEPNPRACDHRHEAIQIIGGALPHEETVSIILTVSFTADTPTAAILARLRHAIDHHARPGAITLARQGKAAYN
jgi:hypothetical protein